MNLCLNPIHFLLMFYLSLDPLIPIALLSGPLDRIDQVIVHKRFLYSGPFHRKLKT
jgi:hypothetical protein